MTKDDVHPEETSLGGMETYPVDKRRTDNLKDEEFW